VLLVTPAEKKAIKEKRVSRCLIKDSTIYGAPAAEGKAEKRGWIHDLLYACFVFLARDALNYPMVQVTSFAMLYFFTMQLMLSPTHAVQDMHPTLWQGILWQECVHLRSRLQDP